MPEQNNKPLGPRGRKSSGWRIVGIAIFLMLLVAAMTGVIGWAGRWSTAGRHETYSGSDSRGPEKTIILILRHSTDSDIDRPAPAYLRVVPVAAVVPQPLAVGWLGTGLAMLCAGLTLRRGTSLLLSR